MSLARNVWHTSSALESFPAKIFRLLPGLALLFAIGFAGKFLEKSVGAYTKANHLTFPNIEYVLWAILIGLVISNTIGVSERFAPGVATYEFWLKMGIVLLGARFLLVDVMRLSSKGLVLVVIEIALSILFMQWLGKFFGLSPKLTSLLAVGSSICGVSAIIAARGAIDAEEDDSSLAIAAIIFSGTLALVTFPLIGHFLGMSDRAFGYWAGLGVDNTAEVAATGALYSETSKDLAVLVKSVRNAAIGFVVLGYALYWAKKGLAKGVSNKGAFLWEKFPKFVLGFLLVSALASFGFFGSPSTPNHPNLMLASLGNASKWCFLLTFAGVGLKTNFREMKKQGFRPFAVGALGEVAIATMTLGLVYGANKFFTL